MRLKKTLAAGAACALLLAALAVPASAHSGTHGHHGRAAASYAVCTVEGCTERGRHDHGGVTYCGYGHAGGFCTGASCSGGGHHGGCHR